MVMVHGWGVSGAGFDAQVEALSAQYRLIIPDLPSHGESPAFPEGGRFSLLADSLAALIAGLELERPILVGWSMGAMVCWDLTLRYTRGQVDDSGEHRAGVRGIPPIDVAGMVSIDMMPRVLAGDDWCYGLGEAWMSEFNISLEAMRADWPAFCASFIPGTFAAANEKRFADTIDRVRQIAEDNDAGGLIRIWQNMLAQDFRDKLPGIDLPSLLVYGARSRLWEEGSVQWMAQHLPTAELRIFRQSGHTPQLEEPERFNQVIIGFAGQVLGNPDSKKFEPAKTGDVLT